VVTVVKTNACTAPGTTAVRSRLIKPEINKLYLQAFCQ
jgi:hypothetical protein